jgi:2-hydroxy-6-oxonona-2,4-dienedioate hydrolase
LQSKSVGEPGPIGKNKKLETVWTRVGGLQIHARVSGGPEPARHPAVVLVHGLVVSSRYMIPTAERLAPHYQVFMPDLPGFGRSERPPGILDVAGLSDALSAWMGGVGLERAALVGNSMGC